MVEERAQRRLAAILAADVVGFSRLMEVDEAATLAALKSRRKDILDPLVAKHQGRIFKTTGDGVLVEFASAVNAVQCAVDLQQAFAVANTDVPESGHIVLRIGVNLGDVMVEGSDLYGDGVNIAARLEAIAEPGGILVSGTAHEYVRNKIKVGFDDLGAQTLKNIAEPARAYRVAGTPAVTIAVAKPATDKPSIAVLPFANMSGDPEQEYFSDGVTEDIITELSRFRSLFVIARSSSFQYKGKNVDIRRVARDLGVQYIVEGSIRRIANRVRITAQFIDTATGNHLWSERFDRTLEEIFDVQDEVVRTIVASLEGRLAATIAERARRKPTEHLGAYDLVLQARNFLNTYDFVAAEPLLRRAMNLDPTYAQAFAWLGAAINTEYFSDPRSPLLEEALELGNKSVTLDPNDALCHWLLGETHLIRGEFEKAGTSLRRALALNPNDALVTASHAFWLSCVGRREEALAGFGLALQCDPFPPSWSWELRAIALFGARRYDEAIQSIRKMDRMYFWNHALLAACFASLGKMDEARAAASEVLTLKPDFSIRERMARPRWANSADIEHEAEGLRKAGLPE